MNKREAIMEFLETASAKHLAKLYTPEMEVQVNVAQDNGKRIQGEYIGKRWIGWTDGHVTWKSFRIPWNANKDPNYSDSEMKFDLPTHVEGIGLTGWNWVKKESLWVGFDFDSIANHKIGLTNEELENVKNMLYDLAYCTMVKSTSGKGIHIYVHLSQSVKTETHTEHAALARSILSVMSMDCGFNFHNTVDACGMVLWIYHRKQENTDGLTLIKQNDDHLFPVSRIPPNWKEQVKVTNGSRKKISVTYNNSNNSNTEQTNFDNLFSSIKVIPLDDEHKKLLSWFSNNTSPNRDSWWDSDHNMLVCHTYDLSRAHKELGLRGIFYTSSSGSSRQNCFCFPSECGSWTVRRHTTGTQEHASWIVDASGWTKCIYNALADFNVCSRANGGMENSKGEHVFHTVAEGLKALSDTGITDIVIPLDMHQRMMSIKEKSDGRLIITFIREAKDQGVPGFLPNNKGDRWEKVVYKPKQKKEVHAPDNLIRHVIANNSEAGWYIYTRDKWIQQSKSNVATVLLSQQHVQNKNDTEQMMGKSILNPWELVNIPFNDEYPGNRKWNRDSAKFSVQPEEGNYKTWLKVLEHCGKSLNEAVSNDPWCIENAINSGQDFLLCWVANLFQRPYEPLPYLFFVGPQNCGKSTFHEAISCLMERGYVRADNALINQQGFNSEIGNAILCIVEETNLSRNKDALNRIKDWVTGKTISINTKHKTVYDMENTTHWIQCANEVNFCPIFPGDTRIVLCRMESFNNSSAISNEVVSGEIPKIELFKLLKEEASGFLHLVLTIELPPMPGRLALPCIKTIEKKELEQMNSSDLERFMEEEIKVCSGKMVTFDEFCTRFQNWLSPDERFNWSKNKISRVYPKDRPYCKGRMGIHNVTYLGNITFNKDDKPDPSELFVDLQGRLQRQMPRKAEGSI